MINALVLQRKDLFVLKGLEVHACLGSNRPDLIALCQTFSCSTVVSQMNVLNVGLPVLALVISPDVTSSQVLCVNTAMRK